MPVNYLLITLISFLATVFFVFALGRLARQHDILVQKKIPLIGGIAIWLSVSLASLYYAYMHENLPPEINSIMITSLLVLIFGMIDDWLELSVLTKLLYQVFAAAFLVILGVRTNIVYVSNALNILITFIWLIGITNAFNHIDIMDGLAAGVAILISAAFLLVSFLSHNTPIQILSLALIGSVCGFAVYNKPPAKVYMGNAGSHTLGFMLAAVALSLSYAPSGREIALLSPVLIVGFLVFDTTFLVFARVRRKRLPFKKSNDHLALRFAALGYSQPKTLAVMFALCAFFAAAGILLSVSTNATGIAVLILVVLLTLVIVRKMDRVIVDGNEKKQVP